VLSVFRDFVFKYDNVITSYIYIYNVLKLFFFISMLNEVALANVGALLTF